jgi:Zn-dependent protease with chaperone function
MRTARLVEIPRRLTALGWTVSILILWLGSMASAQVKPSHNPIVNRRLQNVLEMIPGSATDLPPYLVKSQDVYLLVTAGASYTTVQALANPEVSPATIAHDLAGALAGTSLAGQPVEWSADRYAAAQVTVQHSRWGATQGSSSVAFGPILSGLRRAGLTPHLLLRIPTHASAVGLPRSRYGTRAFRWYDTARLGGRSSVTVTARMTWISLARVLAYYLLIPVLSLLGLRLAHFLSGRGQRDEIARRQLFRTVSTYAVMGSLFVQVGGMVYLIRTPTPAIIADLWFGSSTTTILVPFLVAAAAVLPLFLILMLRQEVRRFGPLPTGPVIPMSDEEKAVRKRVAQYSMVPHLIGAVSLGAVPFFVPRTSPLYQFVHPVAMFLPIVGAGLVARIFQRRLDKFTQKMLNDSLTWRARQLGQHLGVRMPDVFVEDSSRAAHLAFASHQGHHITLSRKLQETFTAAETDFVLAHHLACMKRQSRVDLRWARGLLPLPMLIPAVLLFAPRLIPGAPPMTALLLSAWFFPALIGYFGLFLVLTFTLSGNSAQKQIKTDTEADRDALEITGNLAVAESALDKLGADALSPQALLTMQLNSNLSGKSGKSGEQLTASRIMLRRATLQQTAQSLGLASGAQSPLSPFSAPNTDNRTR